MIRYESTLEGTLEDRVHEERSGRPLYTEDQLHARCKQAALTALAEAQVASCPACCGEYSNIDPTPRVDPVGQLAHYRINRSGAGADKRLMLCGAKGILKVVNMIESGEVEP
jgi:hypothetical protein